MVIGAAAIAALAVAYFSFNRFPGILCLRLSIWHFGESGRLLAKESIRVLSWIWSALLPVLERNLDWIDRATLAGESEAEASRWAF